MRVFNKTIATVVPLNANYNSPSVPLLQVYTYAIQAIITGTPTGTISLQASNDPVLNTISNSRPLTEPTDWNTIANSTFTVTTSGTQFWNVNYTGYNYVRVIYTDSSSGSSTATMTIIFNGKG